MKKNDDILYDLIIIGGGITGLSAAYIAAKQGFKVKIIEKNSNVGGLLGTFDIANTKLECFYHHFFTHDKELNWLINDLGIREKTIFRETSMGVYVDGKIYDFNTSTDLLKFKPIRFFDKIKFGISSIYLGNIAKWKKYEHISCFDWVKKWAGRTTTSSLWEPMLKIKFGVFYKKVPLSWLIGRLRQRMNSREKGNEKLGYIDGSFQVLTDTLLTKLEKLGVDIENDVSIEEVVFKENEILEIKSSDKKYRGQNYLFTIPTTKLSKLLKKDYPELSLNLNKIEYFGAVCVILEMNKPLSNIYWLNVADNNFPFGGIIEHTNFIDNKKYDGSSLAYLSRYYALDEKVANMSKTEIKDYMIKYINKIYPEFDDSCLKNVYVFKTNSAATVCDLNFSRKVPKSNTDIANMYIASMCHIYPDERSVNNAIKVAMESLKPLGIKPILNDKTNSLSGQIGF